MADFPLFVPVDAPWRPGLVVVKARALDGSEDEQTVLPVFQPATQGGRKGVLLLSLPGLSPSTRYTLTVTVLAE
jgi:hypothetical protein